MIHRSLPLWLAAFLAVGTAACDGQDGQAAENEAAAQQEAPQQQPGEDQAFDLSAVGYDLGADDAPVRVIEFSDYGCVHCQNFHAETYPAIRDEFIETGKVAWKYVPISLAGFPNADRAAGAAHCAGEQDRFFEFSDLVYRDASEWTGANDPRPVFTALGEEAGLDMDAFSSCLDDGSRLEEVEENSRLASQIGIRGTPTLVVNGIPVQGAPPLDQFREALHEMVEETEAQGGN